MSFLEHLEELRRRLLVSILAVAVGFLVSWWKAKEIFHLLQKPVLEALPETASALRSAETDDGHCPRCGGLPQLAVFGETGEALLTSPRKLVCSRCANEWVLSRMTCASCGETSGAKMPSSRSSLSRSVAMRRIRSPAASEPSTTRTCATTPLYAS